MIVTFFGTRPRLIANLGDGFYSHSSNRQAFNESLRASFVEKILLKDKFLQAEFLSHQSSREIFYFCVTAVVFHPDNCCCTQSAFFSL